MDEHTSFKFGMLAGLAQLDYIDVGVNEEADGRTSACPCQFAMGSTYPDHLHGEGSNQAQRVQIRHKFARYLKRLPRQ